MEVHGSHLQSSHFFFYNTDSAWIWLIMRVYVGYEWLMAGWEKLENPAGVWVGAKAGVAITGFLKGSLAKTGGQHPDVQAGYAWFIENVALPHATLFSYLVTYGELLVGIALIVGLLTGVAAFFGMVMNFNFLFAGAVSTNPYLIVMEILLVLAWRVAGWWGLDQKFLHYFQRPWKK